MTVTLAASSVTAFDVFNDNTPATGALGIWQITDDQTVRHHSNYHNVDPFSPDGRYVIYTVFSPNRETFRGRGRRLLDTFAVYDLHARNEVFQAERPAVRPIWAGKRNVVYWIKGAAHDADRTLCRLDLTEGAVPRCDDRRERRLPGPVHTMSFDDRHLLAVGPKERGDPTKRRQWVIWQVDPYSLAPPTVFYEHPDFPAYIGYEPLANPRLPFTVIRQARLEFTGKGLRRVADKQARVILDGNGKLLGDAVPEYGGAWHVCWSGDGKYLVRGDGPLRVREEPFIGDADWRILSTEHTSDPSPCGGSGQWLAGISGINGQIFVVDTETAFTRTICYSASIIHQPKDDTRDLSGPWDSDPYGSPDGTKIYFSTNYALKDHPVTRTVERVRRKDDGSGPSALKVESTAGFPDSGVLSVWCCLVSYKRKEADKFLGCEWGYGDTRFPPAISPGVVVTDYRGRCASFNTAAPLGDQASTDVYIAVVRRPDRPALLKDGGLITVHPGYNHRETHMYELFLDGRLLVRLPANVDLKPFVLPEGGTLSVRAVEWSGLRSPASIALIAEAGASVVLAKEATAARPSQWPEVTRSADGTSIRVYRSPEGWPCQRLEYRMDGKLSRRTLYRAPNLVFSVEEYDEGGRRIKETIHRREGDVLGWTRFESGRPMERWRRSYGVFPVHEELSGGQWRTKGP